MQATWEGHCAVNMEKQSCSTNTSTPSQKKKKKLGTVMAPLAVKDARDQINQFRLLKYTFNSNWIYLVEKGQISAMKIVVHTQTMEQNDIDRSSEI